MDMILCVKDDLLLGFAGLTSPAGDGVPAPFGLSRVGAGEMRRGSSTGDDCNEQSEEWGEE